MRIRGLPGKTVDVRGISGDRLRETTDSEVAACGMLAVMTAESPAADDITIVLADDHAVVRKGLLLLVEAEDGLRVVAEAGTVPDALRMARAHRPRVLVLDLNMPGGSSLEAIPELAESTAVVVLTMQDDPSFARQALQSGAKGFVLKEAADDELLLAVHL